MKSPYEKQILKKANETIKILKKEKYSSELLNNSWEEYCVTLKIVKEKFYQGDIKIYYSPKKNTFKYVYKISAESESIKLNKILTGEPVRIYKDKGYEIDVDGSFQNGKTGYGAIIRKEGEVIKELCGIVENDDVDGSRQVAGELRAATEAIEWCVKNSISEVTIYYDYNGIRKWAKGEWKAKKPVTKEYAEFMKNIALKINWIKIKSHTGIYWNEQADKLASKLIINN